MDGGRVGEGGEFELLDWLGEEGVER